MAEYQNPNHAATYTAVNSTLDGIVLGKVDNQAVLNIAPDGPYALSCTFDGGTITNMIAIGNGKNTAGDLVWVKASNDAKLIDGEVRTASVQMMISQGAVVSNYTFKTGAINVYDGGLLSGGVITGGAVRGNAGAIIRGLTIKKGGVLSSLPNRKDGTFYDINIYSGGQMTLMSGGVAYNTVLVSGGDVSIGSGTAKARAETITVQKYNTVSTGASQATITGAGQAYATLNNLINYDKTTLNGGGILNNLEMKGGTENVCSLTVNGTWIVNGGSASHTTTLMMKQGTTLKDFEFKTRAYLFASNMAVEDCTFGGAHYQIRGAIVRRGTLNAGDFYMSANAGEAPQVVDLTFNDGTIRMSAGTIENMTMNGGTLRMSAGTVDGLVMAGGALHMSGGAITGIGIKGTAAATMSATGSDKTVTNVAVSAGGALTVAEGTVTDAAISGENARIVIQGGSAENVTIVGDMTKAQATTNAHLVITTGGEVTDASVAYNAFFSFSAGVAQDLTVGEYGRMTISKGVTVNNLTLDRNGAVVNKGGAINHITQTGGQIYLNNATGETGLVNDLSLADGEVYVQEGGSINNATVAGGTVTVSKGGNFAGAVFTGGTLAVATEALISGASLSGADTAVKFDYSVAGDSTLAIFDTFADVAATVGISVSGVTADKTYRLAETGNSGLAVKVISGLYGDTIAANGSYTNAATGMTYSFDGAAVTTTAFDIGAAKTAAAAITTADTALNTNDRAAKWDANTSYTDSVTLADSTLAGDAWLEIDGTDVSTALYGAEGNFTHTVNINAKSGTIRNLAAGAATGGSVADVKLTLAGADLTGVAYAGGFGNVTGKTATLISDGSFTKDFYAGALANKLATATSVGDVEITIGGGTFSGNIYGASAVKTDTTVGNGSRNTTGDVTLTVTGGATTKGGQACVFAGGYATGDATGTVYTVESVTATISGGTWGTAAGGRGVFGGIMASGVTAQAGNVNLTISGGSMGNVYGGGWAQQGGKSIVGNVNISIEGGEIANVLGGGSHSGTPGSGGTTEAGNVTITVSGGTITGDIYARGHLDGDIVSGDEVSVTFTGDNNFGCGVYGYTYVEGSESDATLAFTDYTGTFSGAIGGFNSINVAGNTWMTLGTAKADVSNGEWKFDFTDRADTLAGTSFLTWDNADFAGDTVKVNFADATLAAAGWNIATADFTGATFDAYAGNEVIAANLAYDTAIEGGAWDGWKFTSVDGTLKFAKLA